MTLPVVANNKQANIYLIFDLRFYWHDCPNFFQYGMCYNNRKRKEAKVFFDHIHRNLAKIQNPP